MKKSKNNIKMTSNRKTKKRYSNTQNVSNNNKFDRTLDGPEKSCNVTHVLKLRYEAFIISFSYL